MNEYLYLKNALAAPSSDVMMQYWPYITHEQLSYITQGHREYLIY